MPGSFSKSWQLMAVGFFRFTGISFRCKPFSIKGLHQGIPSHPSPRWVEMSHSSHTCLAVGSRMSAISLREMSPMSHGLSSHDRFRLSAFRFGKRRTLNTEFVFRSSAFAYVPYVPFFELLAISCQPSALKSPKPTQIPLAT